MYVCTQYLLMYAIAILASMIMVRVRTLVCYHVPPYTNYLDREEPKPTQTVHQQNAFTFREQYVSFHYNSSQLLCCHKCIYNLHSTYMPTFSKFRPIQTFQVNFFHYSLWIQDIFKRQQLLLQQCSAFEIKVMKKDRQFWPVTPLLHTELLSPRARNCFCSARSCSSVVLRAETKFLSQGREGGNFQDHISCYYLSGLKANNL